MAARGLKRRPQLEDLIGEGVSIKPYTPPYTQLADDPRVSADWNLGNDPEDFRRLEHRMRAARAFHDEVRMAAMDRGMSHGVHMARSGHGGAKSVAEDDLVGDHDPEIERSIMEDRAAKKLALLRHMKKLDDDIRRAEEDINHPASQSAAHSFKEAAYGVGAGAAGMMGAPGVVADAAGFFAKNMAGDYYAIAEGIGGAVSNARNAVARHIPRDDYDL